MFDRTDTEWVNLLKSGGTQNTSALTELNILIIKQLPFGLKDSRFENFKSSNKQMRVATNKTLEYVQENMDQYDGTSPFIKWVMKIAVRQLLFEFRFEEWKLTSKDGKLPEVPDDWYPILAENEFLQYAHTLFKQELSVNQRIAIRSMVMFRMPKEEIMRQLAMERCDYFAIIHDSRLRIKKRLQRDGILPMEEMANE